MMRWHSNGQSCIRPSITFPLCMRHDRFRTFGTIRRYLDSWTGAPRQPDLRLAAAPGGATVSYGLWQRSIFSFIAACTIAATLAVIAFYALFDRAVMAGWCLR